MASPASSPSKKAGQAQEATGSTLKFTIKIHRDKISNSDIATKLSNAIAVASNNMQRSMVGSSEVAGNPGGLEYLERLTTLERPVDKLNGTVDKLNVAVKKIVPLESKVEDLESEVENVKSDLKMVKPWFIDIRKRNIDTRIRDRATTGDIPAERPVYAGINGGNEIAHDGNIAANYYMCIEPGTDIKYITNFRRLYGVDANPKVYNEIRQYPKMIEVCNQRGTAVLKQKRGSETKERDRVIAKAERIIYDFNITDDREARGHPSRPRAPWRPGWRAAPLDTRASP